MASHIAARGRREGRCLTPRSQTGARRAKGTAATGEWPVAAVPSDKEKEEKEVIGSLIGHAFNIEYKTGAGKRKIEFFSGPGLPASRRRRHTPRPPAPNPKSRPLHPARDRT